MKFEADGREIGRFEQLVNPRRPVNPGARAVHGIPDELLANAPGAEVVLPRFVDWLGDPAGTVLLAASRPVRCRIPRRRAGAARPADAVARGH